MKDNVVVQEHINDLMKELNDFSDEFSQKLVKVKINIKDNCISAFKNSIDQIQK